MRATGTDDTHCFSGATGKSFVALPVGERGQTVSFAVISPDDGDEQMGSGATQRLFEKLFRHSQRAGHELGATVTALRGRAFVAIKARPRKAVTVAP